MGAVGASMFAVGGMLRATSTGLLPLLLWSALFGLGWGLSLPTLPKIIGGWFDPKIAGTFTGIYSIGIYGGAGTATAIIFFDGWREAVLTWGILTAAVAIFWRAVTRDPPVPPVQAPTDVRSVLRNRNLWILTAVFFLGAHITFYALTGWLPTILSLRLTPSTAAFVASLLSFTAAAATLVIPVLSDRIRRRKPFLYLPALAGAVVTYPIFGADLLLTGVSVAILGAAISAIFVVCLILPIELVPREMVGRATGLMLVAYTGGVLAPWLVGVTRDLTGSFLPTMLLLIVAFLAAMTLSFFLPETGKH
jgi:CP family cyanate transporter-like MFS transporter